MTKSSIPKGWRVVNFGDVVDNMNETTKDPEAIGLDRVVGLDHMDPESLPLKRWDNLSDLHEGTSFTRIFRAGQVLFGKRRAYQRKVSLPGFDGICSGDILVFQPKNTELLPEFLPYLVQSDGFFDHALGTSAGSLSPRTKWQELAKYEFALPPIAEQHRIVKVLKAAHDAAAFSSEARTDELRVSLIHSIFSNNSYQTRELHDFAEISIGGIWGSASGMDECDVEIVRQTEFCDNATIAIGEGEIRSISSSQLANRQLQKKDILIQKSAGTPSLCGRVVRVEHGLEQPVVCSNFLHMLRIKGKEETSDYVFWALWYLHRVGQVFNLQRGTSIRNLDMNKYLKQSIPDLHSFELIEFSNKLQALDRLDVQIEKQNQSLMKTSHTLREALLIGAHV